MKLRYLFFIPLFLLTISLYTGNTLPNNSTKFNNSDTLEIQNIIKIKYLDKLKSGDT